MTLCNFKEWSTIDISYRDQGRKFNTISLHTKYVFRAASKSQGHADKSISVRFSRSKLQMAHLLKIMPFNV